jgi:hypothetical protein
MQKKKKSFADLAKQILSKYKRRLGEKLDGNDPMAQAAMQKELDALMEEQENVKASMVQSQYQEMAYGGDLLPFQQNASTPFPVDIGNSNMFSYVNPITGELSSTAYNRLEDQEFLIPPKSTNTYH